MDAKPSKSARKREAQAVDALAARLVALTDADLSRLPLDDELRALVVETRAIRSRSAGRRQRQYLSKRLRQADTRELEAAIAALDRGRQADRRLFHAAESWRDRLLDEPAALGEFAALTGRAPDALAGLLESLRPGAPEAERRRLGREIFRAVHAELEAVMHRDAPSI